MSDVGIKTKPLVDAKLLIRGKIRLRDLEEIMIRLRDEFNITSFHLQICSFMGSAEYQEIEVPKVNLIRHRDGKGRFVKMEEKKIVRSWHKDKARVRP